MKKSALFLFFAAFVSVAAMAQTIQEGINHLYAQRLQSAKANFEKLLTANPNNIEASYWLGQTYIAQKDIATARTTYEKAAATSNNAPLIMAGLGHVLLLENKPADAKQQFENAINASHGKKGNDPTVLNAVGRANVDAYTESNKIGDLDYAISKLTEASTLAPTNGDIFINLGNAYRKKRNGESGGLAVQAYRKAAQLPGTGGIGYYRIGMLYKTQVNYRQLDNWTVVLDNFNNAITNDPKFAPAYEELYYYYLYKKDYTQAEDFANKDIANSDPSVENDYLKIQTSFVQNNFDAAIAGAKNIIAQTNGKAKPRVYRLLGYSYMGIKDTTTACDYVNQFFAKATDEDIIGQDYILHAQACGRNNPDMIWNDITKAVQMDSVPARQINMLVDAMDDARKAGQRLLVGQIGLFRYNLLGDKANPASLVNIGTDFYFGGQPQKGDSLFQLYNKAFPDSIYGYLWSMRAMQQIDTAMTQGLAVPPAEQVLRVSETDKTRELYKSNGASAAAYIAAYYINTKQDRAAAKPYVERGLLLDSANTTLLAEKKIVDSKPPARQTATEQKTNTSTNAAKKTPPVKTKKG